MNQQTDQSITTAQVQKCREDTEKLIGRLDMLALNVLASAFHLCDTPSFRTHIVNYVEAERSKRIANHDNDWDLWEAKDVT